ncbi:MAG: hypothetical protein ABEI11_03090 [Haloarculaceae archaeon]
MSPVRELRNETRVADSGQVVEIGSEERTAVLRDFLYDAAFDLVPGAPVGFAPERELVDEPVVELYREALFSPFGGAVVPDLRKDCRSAGKPVLFSGEVDRTFDPTPDRAGLRPGQRFRDIVVRHEFPLSIGQLGVTG